MTRFGKSSDEIAKILRDSGSLPTLKQVNAHGIAFFPRHWLGRWDATMPPVPPVLTEGELDNRDRKCITRKDLFDLGARVETPEDAVNFYVAVCSWGAGTKARDVYRRVGTLTQPEVEQKLLQAILLAKDPQTPADEAYQAFYSYSRSRLKGLGPAFFTKLLYFAAGTGNGRQLRHLILDQRVAPAIGWPNKSRWSPAEYQSYLDLIDEVLELIPEAERADCLEMRLFDLSL